jgi:hypothetical protein
MPQTVFKISKIYREVHFLLSVIREDHAAQDYPRMAFNQKIEDFMLTK